MTFNKKAIASLILLGLLFLPSGAVHAQSPGGDVVLFGQNYTLESGDTLSGSVVVFGGNVIIEDGAEVNGDVALFGGNLDIAGDVDGDVALFGGNMTISGHVNGDVAMFGGQAQLTSTAVLDGNISTVGGQLNRDPGAQVAGDIVNNAPPVEIPGTPNVPPTPGVNVSFNPVLGWFKIFFQALIMGGIAALLTLFLDAQIKRVGDYAVSQMFIAGSVGLLTVFVCILLFLTILPIFVVVIAWLLGIVALGQEVGDRFTRAINQTWQPVLSTAFGTFLLTLIAGYVGLVPCAGWLVNFVIALVGIGAVIMTRFGTRSNLDTPTPVVTEVPAS